jgi:hypothetical protein
LRNCRGKRNVRGRFRAGTVNHSLKVGKMGEIFKPCREYLQVLSGVELLRPPQKNKNQLKRIALIGVVLEMMMAGSSMNRMQMVKVPRLSQSRYHHSNLIGTNEI